jgi:hypothetical protein
MGSPFVIGQARSRDFGPFWLRFSPRLGGLAGARPAGSRRRSRQMGQSRGTSGPEALGPALQLDPLATFHRSQQVTTSSLGHSV